MSGARNVVVTLLQDADVVSRATQHICHREATDAYNGTRSIDLDPLARDEGGSNALTSTNYENVEAKRSFPRNDGHGGQNEVA